MNIFSYLERIIICKIRLNNVDVGAIDFLADSLVCRNFVSHNANDGVVRVCRETAKEFELRVSYELAHLTWCVHKMSTALFCLYTYSNTS